MKKAILAILLVAASSFASWTGASTVASLSYQEGAGSDAGKMVMLVTLTGNTTGYIVRSDAPGYASIQAALESALTSRKSVLLYETGAVNYTYCQIGDISGACSTGGTTTNDTWHKITAVQKRP